MDTKRVDDRRLARWQGIHLGLMVLGYTGYYVCRSNFSVALPEIRAELAEAPGIDLDRATLLLGRLASFGMIAYAVGKLFGGALTDFLGGRFTFLTGMAGSVAFTLLFAAGGAMPVFTMAWVGNRMAQSLGWPGMVKVASRWYPFSTYGTVMAILSLSYLFGDAASRAFMGLLFRAGLEWREVFAAAAGVLAAVLVLNAWLLRNAPGQLGLEEPETNPANLFGGEGSTPTPSGLRDLVGTLLGSPAFVIVCLLSFGLTLLRETFNIWTPTYFVDGVGLSVSASASTSAVFPMAGGVSVILVGVLSDRIGGGGRAMIMATCLALAGAVLLVLGPAGAGRPPWVPVALVALVAFLLVGPYSYLAGAFALDFGGKRGSATASSLIDFVGYLGGYLSGITVARASTAYGWGGAFRLLAVVAWVSAALAVVLMIVRSRPPRATEGAARGASPTC